MTVLFRKIPWMLFQGHRPQLAIWKLNTANKQDSTTSNTHPDHRRTSTKTDSRPCRIRTSNRSEKVRYDGSDEKGALCGSEPLASMRSTQRLRVQKNEKHHDVKQISQSLMVLGLRFLTTRTAYPMQWIKEPTCRSLTVFTP